MGIDMPVRGDYIDGLCFAGFGMNGIKGVNFKDLNKYGYENGSEYYYVIVNLHVNEIGL